MAIDTISRALSGQASTAAKQAKETADSAMEQAIAAVPGAVSDWLEDNVTPTTPVVDASLSIAGAAADAKATGDGIADLKSATSVQYHENLMGLLAYTNGAGVNPTTGANQNNNAKLSRTSLFNIPHKTVILEMDSAEYEFTAWLYSSKSASSGVQSLTNNEYTNKTVIASQTDTGIYMRVGFRRVDGVDLTTGASDPTSDEYKIRNNFKIYSIVDKFQNDEITAIEDGVYYTIDEFTPGFIDSNGTEREQSTTYLEQRTKRLHNVKNAIIEINYDTPLDSWISIAKYDVSGAWITTDTIINSLAFNVYEKIAIDDNVDSIIISMRTISAINISVKISFNDCKIIQNVSTVTLNPARFKPHYDHLFVNRTTDTVIPHESLHHLRLSAKMGFNMFEVNTAQTSDGVWVVNHFDGGTFGQYFHHVDGTTDISNIAVSSVTWEWIQNNVRYNSTIEKYRTAPSRLETILSECRQQNIIPFIMVNDSDVLTITEKIMGKNNYVAYKATREQCPNGIIYHWKGLTTKSEILEYCESVGKPFIYGMSNPTSFSDADLQDIIDTLHANGYLIGTSYQDNRWTKYRRMGFDLNGTQKLINRITNGNLYNIDSMNGFSSFIVTGATESNGVLTFGSGTRSIQPDIPDTSYSVCGIDVEIVHSGTITFKSIGEFTSDFGYDGNGENTIVLSIPIINGSPKFQIVPANGCVIYDLTFRASKFS